MFQVVIQLIIKCEINACSSALVQILNAMFAPSNNHHSAERRRAVLHMIVCSAWAHDNRSHDPLTGSPSRWYWFKQHCISTIQIATKQESMKNFHTQQLTSLTADLGVKRATCHTQSYVHDLNEDKRYASASNGYVLEETSSPGAHVRWHDFVNHVRVVAVSRLLFSFLLFVDVHFSAPGHN